MAPRYKHFLALENGKFVGQHQLIEDDKMVSRSFPKVNFDLLEEH